MRGNLVTLPRSQQISLEHTPYYHCTSRCVRRAFLCGKDRYSGKSFNHRKQWLEERLRTLSGVFAIDLLAYAIMSNHYHVVVRLDTEQALRWSDDEIRARWEVLFAVPDQVTPEHIARWRKRLSSLSWYMRCLNEPLARLANREDQCKGRFWEGRFKCQALLDEQTLLKCMAYVDLNPIRAAVANTPETSDHTSIKARIERGDGHLLPFFGSRNSRSRCIPLRRDDYLQLVDWTGRAMRKGKRGRIPASAPPILERLRLNGDDWIREMQHYGRWYYRAAGSLRSLQNYCQHLGLNWLKGSGRMASAAA